MQHGRPLGQPRPRIFCDSLAQNNYMAAALLASFIPLSLSAGGVAARCHVKMQIGGGLAIKAIPPPPPPTAAQIVSEFSTWCKGHGVQGLAPSGPCAVQLTDEADESSRAGIYATRAVQQGEALLAVPLKLALADRGLIGLDGVAPVESTLPGELAVAARLLAIEIPLQCRVSNYKEHLKGAEWEPWMDLLLLSAKADAKAVELDDEVVFSFAQMMTASPMRARTAMAVARARSFAMDLDGISCQTLLPLIDLFKAPESGEESHAAVALDDKEDMLHITAGRDIAEGEQLTIAL